MYQYIARTDILTIITHYILLQLVFAVNVYGYQPSLHGLSYFYICNLLIYVIIYKALTIIS